MRKYERVTTRPVEVAANPAPDTAPATVEALFGNRPARQPRHFRRSDAHRHQMGLPDLRSRSLRAVPAAIGLAFYSHRLPADGNGFFDHDFTSPPPGGDAYEYIQFNSVDIREIAARVNFYGGSIRAARLSGCESGLPAVPMTRRRC